MTQVQMFHYGFAYGSAAGKQWSEDFAEIIKRYIAGEPIYVGFDTKYEPKRKGSVGRLVITNIQDLLHGESEYHYNRYNGRNTREKLAETSENVKPENLLKTRIDGHIVWEGRKNRIQLNHWSQYIIDDHQGGTNWVYEAPVEPTVEAKDKLGRVIAVGDFISYVLYHFDNGDTAAGIYYGKVTKISKDGTVHAKNIKLKPDDAVADKRIKDNSLIVIMTKDIMDQLMLAKLSAL